MEKSLLRTAASFAAEKNRHNRRPLGRHEANLVTCQLDNLLSRSSLGRIPDRANKGLYRRNYPTTRQPRRRFTGTTAQTNNLPHDVRGSFMTLSLGRPVLEHGLASPPPTHRPSKTPTTTPARRRGRITSRRARGSFMTLSLGRPVLEHGLASPPPTHRPSKTPTTTPARRRGRIYPR